MKRIIPAIVLALALSASAQVYTLSAPLSGSLTLSMTDPNGPWGNGGGVIVNFTNLAETITLDMDAGTIRQEGWISVANPVNTFTFAEVQNGIPGLVTVTYELSSGGQLCFDTGPRNIGTPSEWGSYYFDSWIPNLGTINMRCTLNTGGKIYSSGFGSEVVALYLEKTAWTFSAFELMDDPTKLRVWNLGDSNPGWMGWCQPIQTAILADNGFNLGWMQGQVGLSSGYGIPADFMDWYHGKYAVATMIPEPSAVWLISLLVLAFIRHRQ